MEYKVISLPKIREFITQSMISVGVNVPHSQLLADNLVTADYRGHFSHGLNRLQLYLMDIKENACNPNEEPSILKESASTAVIDGNNSLGAVVGTFAMNLAIKKAKESGIGWVVARRSNHFGIAGYYSLMASKEGLIGMAFTNASPLVAPTRGIEPFFGTNPISLAASGQGSDEFVLDMATSVVALGKIEMQSRKGESMSPHWATDEKGKPTTDPNKFHALLPVGGIEQTSGYKGYGLAMLVEIFCGVLSGSTCAPNLRKWTDNHTMADLGQCFVAINPEFFAPGFDGRLTDLLGNLRNQNTAEGETEILIHGDPEKRHMLKCDQLGGIPYHPNQIKFANEIAASLNIDPPS